MFKFKRSSLKIIILITLAVLLIGAVLFYLGWCSLNPGPAINVLVEVPTPPPASESTPITLDREEYFTYSGKTIAFKINVYNNQTVSLENITPEIICNGELATLKTQFQTKTLQPKQQQQYAGLLQTPKIKRGKYLCNIVIPNIGQKSFYMNIDLTPNPSFSLNDFFRCPNRHPEIMY